MSLIGFWRRGRRARESSHKSRIARRRRLIAAKLRSLFKPAARRGSHRRLRDLRLHFGQAILSQLRGRTKLQGLNVLLPGNPVPPHVHGHARGGHQSLKLSQLSDLIIDQAGVSRAWIPSQIIFVNLDRLVVLFLLFEGARLSESVVFRERRGWFRFNNCANRSCWRWLWRWGRRHRRYHGHKRRRLLGFIVLIFLSREEDRARRRPDQQQSDSADSQWPSAFGLSRPGLRGRGETLNFG